MPYIENSLYKPPALMRSAHLLTIYPSLFRKIRDVKYERERINTPEADYLDIDWSRIGSSKVAIISHGLEGHTQRSYVLGMVRALNKHGWDVAAWNFRGCSGEPNRLPQFYHSGSSDDLETVINHIRGLGKYEKIDLVGFSMGGNITLKYLGEKSGEVPQEIGRAVAFSVPCDLKNSSYKLDKLGNALYMRRFLRSLRVKFAKKRRCFRTSSTMTAIGKSKILNILTIAILQNCMVSAMQKIIGNSAAACIISKKSGFPHCWSALGTIRFYRWNVIPIKLPIATNIFFSKRRNTVGTWDLCNLTVRAFIGRSSAQFNFSIIINADGQRD